MNRLAVLALLALFACSLDGGGQEKKTLATDLRNPTSVAVGPDGRVYVAIAGDKEGEGAILVLDKSGKPGPLAKGLTHPTGLASHQKSLYVADKTQILKIDTKGKVDVYTKADAFPVAPVHLGDLVVDPEGGTVYVADVGSKENKGGAIYRIPTKGKGTVVTDQTKWETLKQPGAIVMDGQNHLLLLDAGDGTLHRLTIADGTHEKVADGFGSGDGLTWDKFGRLYISDGQSGKISVIGRPGMSPEVIGENLHGAVDICLDPSTKQILVPDRKTGAITAMAARVPSAPVDDTPLKIETVVAFPDLKWTGWESENEKGVPTPLRPLVLTYANDGSNRTFVATQHGVIHAFPNDPKATKTQVFLDIQQKVLYNDKQNEEGFLGLAFHPQFKKNGEFFAFYTPKRPKGGKNVNVVCRFRVSKDDPNKADPASEEELIRFEHNYFNHDGGTICFGPDGYLYIAVGDGGSANDPHNNGQNLNTLLAKILRIDVDHKENGKNYAIPKDNPFVGKADARGEVWAYGLRNVWRMAFDRKTGTLWAGEVGQNLYEEINIIVKGGNYGWKLRESFHPFSAKGVGHRKDLVDPIWEYHHSVGVSITGGGVYRGKKLPELDGAYLYGDYVNGKIWALRYDDKAKRVIANQQLTTRGLNIFSFGEDEQGEMYFLSPANNGKGIHTFQRMK